MPCHRKFHSGRWLQHPILSPAALTTPELAPSPPATTIRQRLLRFWPYFRSASAGIGLAAVCTIVGALTEPMIPALLKTLLDRGFSEGLSLIHI